jgi:hypothetical protein
MYTDAGATILFSHIGIDYERVKSGEGFRMYVQRLNRNDYGVSFIWPAVGSTNRDIDQPPG